MHQRRVGVVEGRGGSESLSCPLPIYPPFAHAAQPGTWGALSVRNGRSGQNTSGPFASVWTIAENHRDLALFNLAIDSKLRGCDLMKLKVADVYASGQVKERASIVQSKTQRPVRFEITEGTRRSLSRWMEEPMMVGSEYLWPGRFHDRLHISTRQYARLVRDWVKSIGLDSTSYGTHSMRRTKVAHIYRKTGNLRAVQLLLGHTKMGSTVRYLGVELEDALVISESVEI